MTRCRSCGRDVGHHTTSGGEPVCYSCCLMLKRALSWRWARRRLKRICRVCGGDVAAGVLPSGSLGELVCGPCFRWRLLEVYADRPRTRPCSAP